MKKKKILYNDGRYRIIKERTDDYGISLTVWKRKVQICGNKKRCLWGGMILKK